MTAGSGAPGNPAGMPPFPGAVGISGLQVYPWQTDDGLHGGSPHVHLCCAECYVVVAGRGRLQTLTPQGFEESTLTPGDVVWFTPGTIHRAVNDDGALGVVVVMQNSGLPEAGDAVLTVPPAHLADLPTYRRAVSLTGPDGSGPPSADRARARRDLAIEGFTELRRRYEAGDTAALDEFYAAATALAGPQLDAWQARWESGPVAVSRQTGEQIDALRRGDHSHLAAAAVSRIARPDQTTLGMCGFLSAYDPLRAGRG
ncbi:cupin domain-containing protein [Plantactinospora solaniradicis]|uniref:Cupin domain-containing protein n=1 Tax=Plantactinospora solaniradicis TaxID=1723736 RepID=A0ABW1K4J6_9ACTN